VSSNPPSGGRHRPAILLSLSLLLGSAWSKSEGQSTTVDPWAIVDDLVAGRVVDLSTAAGRRLTARGGSLQDPRSFRDGGPERSAVVVSLFFEDRAYPQPVRVEGGSPAPTPPSTPSSPTSAATAEASTPEAGKADAPPSGAERSWT